MNQQISYEQLHQLEDHCQKLRSEAMLAMVTSPVPLIWKKLCALTLAAGHRVLRQEPL